MISTSKIKLYLM